MPSRRWSRDLGAVVLAVVTAGVLTLAVLAPARPGPAAATNVAAPAGAGPGAGAEIWNRDCAVCHDTRGTGTSRGPDITGSGTAAVDFMVRTGRMPPPDPPGLARGPGEAPEVRDSDGGPVRYTDDEIRSLVAYAGTLVQGPGVPDAPDLAAADPVRGGAAYRLRCAACHQLAGNGGPLAYGTTAPALGGTQPVQVIEAMRTGPGSMPVYPPDALSDDEARDVAAYVHTLGDPVDRGGASLWHLGPVPEGLVAWGIAVLAVLAVCRWLGQRDRVSTD